MDLLGLAEIIRVVHVAYDLSVLDPMCPSRQLLLASFFILQQGAQILAPFANVAGLSTHYVQENAIVPPTLYDVPASNFTFASEYLTGGGQFVGSVNVANGRQVGFYVMNEGNFSLWRAGRPAVLVLAEPLAISYNFTITPTYSATYYFVFDNEDTSSHVVIFSLSSVQNAVALNPLLQYAGLELLFLGIVLCYFGLRGGKRKAEAKGRGDSGWKCKYCGAKNVTEDHTFCAKCGRAQN
jgi:hypothetical protein